MGVGENASPFAGGNLKGRVAEPLDFHARAVGRRQPDRGPATTSISWQKLRTRAGKTPASESASQNALPLALVLLLAFSRPQPFRVSPTSARRSFTSGGWYRKRLGVPGEWSGRRFFLEFDGVFQVAEVFVNGVRVGEHRGGYTGFRFDITEEVRRRGRERPGGARQQQLGRPPPAAPASTFSAAGSIATSICSSRTRFTSRGTACSSRRRRSRATRPCASGRKCETITTASESAT